MTKAQLFWTLATAVATFLILFSIVGWSWWLSLILAWIAAGVMASISGVK